MFLNAGTLLTANRRDVDASAMGEEVLDVCSESVIDEDVEVLKVVGIDEEDETPELLDIAAPVLVNPNADKAPSSIALNERIPFI